MRRQVGREGLDRGQYADDYFSASAFNGSGVWGDIRPVPYFPDRCPSSCRRCRRRRCDLLCFLQLYVFLFDDDGEFRSGSLFYFAGGIAWLFIVLSDPRDVGDEVRAAPHCLYPLDFSGSLEIAPAAGGSSDQVDWQKSGKTFWETGKKREKSCAKTQKTLANKANIIV